MQTQSAIEKVVDWTAGACAVAAMAALPMSAVAILGLGPCMSLQLGSQKSHQGAIAAR